MERGSDAYIIPRRAIRWIALGAGVFFALVVLVSFLDASAYMKRAAAKHASLGRHFAPLPAADSPAPLAAPRVPAAAASGRSPRPSRKSVWVSSGVGGSLAPYFQQRQDNFGH
ncbi:MAG TPA: hypothetical protein VJT32_06025 [bacterium]|nr:hypothetical protein [bacterium]